MVSHSDSVASILLSDFVTINAAKNGVIGDIQ
jgi:hypothetical protein